MTRVLVVVDEVSKRKTSVCSNVSVQLLDFMFADAALSPHSKKVLGLIPGRSLSVWRLHVLPVSSAPQTGPTRATPLRCSSLRPPVGANNPVAPL